MCGKFELSDPAKNLAGNWMLRSNEYFFLRKSYLYKPWQNEKNYAIFLLNFSSLARLKIVVSFRRLMALTLKILQALITNFSIFNFINAWGLQLTINFRDLKSEFCVS